MKVLALRFGCRNRTRCMRAPARRVLAEPGASPERLLPENERRAAGKDFAAHRVLARRAVAGEPYRVAVGHGARPALRAHSDAGDAEGLGAVVGLDLHRPRPGKRDLGRPTRLVADREVAAGPAAGLVGAEARR